MRFHPYSEVFPLFDNDKLVELAEDIKATGLREPIWIYDGQVLDGRNRFLACQKAKVKPRYRDYKGNDPLSFVVSLNIQRRHLSDAQRAFAAARISTLRQGQAANASRDAFTQGDAASQLNVSRSSVQRARKVIESGSPELQQAVEAGAIPLRRAAEVADLPQSDQFAAATSVPEFKLEHYDPTGDDAALARAEQIHTESMDKFMDSDDRVSALIVENKRLAGLLAGAEQSRDHYQNQAGEAVRQLKAAQRKLEKLERKSRQQIAEVQDRAPGVQ